MNQYRRARRVGACAIVLALVMRLSASGFWDRAARFLSQPNIASFLLYLETGRHVRFSPSLEAFSPDFVESPVPSLPKPTEPPIPSFSGTETIELYYAADKDPDISGLLSRPLHWELRGEEPAVLILHTHSTESYTKNGESYVETSSWRTLDESYNMLSIGARVKSLLEEAGIRCIHDTGFHDYPSYNGSYVHARSSIKAILEENPSIQLILDLHRDASAGENGKQLRTKATVDGKYSAQLMVVIGTNHKNYEENLSLGLKLHAQLERQAPGITRPLQLRAQRFNQDLCTGGLLIEVGAAGNTHPEAMTAAEELAKAVIALAGGTATAEEDLASP